MKLMPRGRRWLWIAAAAVIVFTVVGFFVVPPIAKSQLEQRLSAELGRRVTVERVRVNPYTLSVTLEGFAMREREGAATFVGWRRLYVNFDALSSLWGEWVLSEVALDGFAAQVTINPDQSFNFSDLLTKFAPPAPAAASAAPPPPAKPSRPVRVVSLKVSDSSVDFSDRSRKQPFATKLGPLTFALTEFYTAGQHGAPYHFEAVTEAGEKLAWSGTLQAEPVRSVGDFALENILLPKYAPYYADRVQADLTAGTLAAVRGHYELSLDEKQRVLKLAGGALQLRGLKLVERATQALAVELPTLDVTGIQADALTLKASIGSVALAGGHVRVRREKDGTINLIAMLLPPAVPALAAAPAPPPTAPPAAAPKPPEFMIGEVALKDFQIEVADLGGPRPAQLALTGLQLSLKNVTLAEGAQMPLQLALSWAPQGTVKVDGTVGLAPVKADLKVDVVGLEFLPLSPYLEQFVNAHLTQGAITTTLDVKALLADKAPPAVTVAGDVRIEKFGVIDAAHNEELGGFSTLALRGLRASTTPELSVVLEEINLTGPYARVIVNADKTLNLATVLRSEVKSAPAATLATTTNAPASPSPAAAPRPKIEIGKIVIADGDYRFTDRSLEPNVTTAINQFGGTISGLSSVNPTKADVDLKATVDGAGPIAITGKLDPLATKPFVDLKVDFKNVDLLPLSPYSGKFAGYELARGQLALDVKLLVDGKKIDATNVLTLNQFTFGTAVQSPEATSLPVRLGVALLKDIDGKIVIDVPVQGSTDDPSFKVGRVVLRVIVNLLTKAAVSPFSLLGAAFGGGGDELAYQEFAPGSAELQPAEMKKLQTMVQALTNRPGLSVGLEGRFDAAADAYALKRLKLAAEVRRAIWEQKHLADPNVAPPEALAITPVENAAMIKKLFDEKFPPGTQFGTPLPAPPVVVTPPPPPAGFFKRLVKAVTFKAKREARAAAQENARRAAEHEQAVATAAAAGLPIEEMTGRLAEAVPIDDNDLRALAAARARQVRDYFANVGKIPIDRLFLAKENDQAGAAKVSKGPRVMLTLQ